MVAYIVNKQAIKMTEGKKNFLAYLIACVVSKQTIKMQKKQKSLSGLFSNLYRRIML